MEMNGSRLMLIVLAGIVTATSFYFIKKNDASNISVNSSLVSNVEENKKNITLIKQSLEQLLVASQTKNVDVVDSSNEQLNTINTNIQALTKSYSNLSDELQSIKQKNVQKDTLQNSLTENVVIEASQADTQRKIEEATKREAEFNQQYEESWQLGSDDTIAATEMQSELGSIFTPDQKGINVVNSECKSSGCKITLGITDEFSGGSPVAMLVDSEGSFFKDKDFIIKENIDPSTGETEITVYVTKPTDEESL